MNEQTCLFCGKETKDGLWIFSALLCSQCEKELLNTEVAAPRYGEYVAKLKKVWSSYTSDHANEIS